MAYESKNNNEDAIKIYRRIRDEFPMSMQSRNMDKYLARLGDYNP
jgi:hypothetical protein